MKEAIVVSQNIVVLVVFGFIGWILCKLKLIDGKQVKILSVLEVWIFMPCKTLTGFASSFTLEYISKKYTLIFASAVILLVTVIVSYPLTKLFVKDTYNRNIYRYEFTLPNYGYIGYALVESLYGSEGLLNAMVFVLPLQIYAYTVGYSMLTGSKISAKRLINPIFFGIVAGAVLGLTGVELPWIVSTIVSQSGSFMAPLAMIMAGIVISQMSIKEMFKGVGPYIVSLVRLIIVPLCAFAGMFKLFGLELAMTAAVICATPCGLNPIVIPKSRGLDCTRGASYAFTSIMFSLMTLPFLTWALITVFG